MDSSGNTLSWHNEKRLISELVKFENNPRILSSSQKEHLRNSLSKFNLVELPVVNLDNTILAGHQRCKVLLEIKGDHEIEVRVPNRLLDEEEAKEYLIRSNKNSGVFDFDMLESEFEIDDLIYWGFDEDDFEIDTKVESRSNSDDEPLAEKIDITLSYSPEEYGLVIDAVKASGKSPEQLLFECLGLDK